MKTKILLFVLLSSFVSNAQPRGVAKMAPILSDGYFINRKGDSIRGKVQVNPPAETDFYSQFWFKLPRSKKMKVMNTKLSKAYGYDNKNYVMANYNGKQIYLERLVTGRLNFYEYKFMGKIDGYAAVESYYFIKDTGAEGKDADLKELKKISGMFYKKSLKPYMKDQPFIWNDLDKYNFEPESVVKAVNEFNKYYAIAGN